MKNGIYKVIVLPSVLKEVRRIPRFIFARIQTIFYSLAENPFPHNSEKLQDYDHYYRIRVGDYRIVYTVDTHIRIVTVKKVGHRKDVYRRL